MEVIEHVAASRVPPQGYRDPLARVEGSMIAVAKRADASLRRPWGSAFLAVIVGGCSWATWVVDGSLGTGIVGTLVALLFAYATSTAWARELARLRLEVRDGRVIARATGVWARTVSVAIPAVRAFDVVTSSAGSERVLRATLVARLEGDRTVTLLEPLSSDDAERLRELATSALGLGAG